jgi:hypothetical protein
MNRRRPLTEADGLKTRRARRKHEDLIEVQLERDRAEHSADEA